MKANSLGKRARISKYHQLPFWTSLSLNNYLTRPDIVQCECKNTHKANERSNSRERTHTASDNIDTTSKGDSNGGSLIRYSVYGVEITP